MPKAPRTALIGVGPVSQSWVAKLPGLRQSLGPVKSTSLRIASRLVNTMKAGVGTDSLESFRKVDLILLAIPDRQLAGWVNQLVGCEAGWAGVSFVVCSRTQDSSALSALRERGASTCSLDVMEGFEGKRYLFEGEKLALHRVRRLIEEEGTARVVQLNEQMRPVYDAGLTFAAGMTFPMIAAAVDTMRAAGLHSKIAEGVVETAVMGALRAYLRAGKRGWSGPIARADRAELSRQYKCLFEVDPALGEMFLKIAVDYLVDAAPGRKGLAKRESSKTVPGRRE